MPKIIIYKNQASIFNTPALEFGSFFIDWMDDKYTQLEHIERATLIKNPSLFDLKTDLYILNKDMDMLLKKLEQAGYVELDLNPSESDTNSS
jgi:hypothetical protein